MYNALIRFKNNIEEVRNIGALHSYLKSSILAPMTFDDLLRSQIVYSVSAFDKLIHDLVIMGMVEIFSSKRLPTKKYLSENISLETYLLMQTSTIPPKEFLFEQELFQKLKHISYQSPEKIADGLSYIWNEKHKWQKISSLLAMNEEFLKVQLKLIVDRRNRIVHEADFDPITLKKSLISESETDTIIDFIESCGETIAKLVI